MSAIRKSEFAKRCNVSAPCVSQWISGGKIDGAALVGEGRSAMIDVDIAHAQLKERLDPTKRFGSNGLDTNLNDDVPPPRPHDDQDQSEKQVQTSDKPLAAPNPPVPQAREGEDPETVDARIKAEKLKQNEILTRADPLRHLHGRGRGTRRDDFHISLSDWA